jgi:hypothetical protein
MSSGLAAAVFDGTVLAVLGLTGLAVLASTLRHPPAPRRQPRWRRGSVRSLVVGRATMEHHLKLHARWFDAVAGGAKTVELRREDDRRFAVGDVLVLHEHRIIASSGPALPPVATAPTGRTCRVVVTHVLRHADVPDLLPPGVAALSIRRDKEMT